LTALVVVATVSTSTAHQGKLVLFLLAYVWLYFGGTTPEVAPATLLAYKPLATPKNYFLHASDHSLLALEASCNAYFLDYFSLHDDAAWDTDVTYTTSGLCSRWWIGFLLIIAYVQACALLLMVALKVLSFLDPNLVLPMKMPELKTGVVAEKAPAEEAIAEAGTAEA